MKKKLLISILAVLLIICTLSVNVSAAKAQCTFYYGGNINSNDPLFYYAEPIESYLINTGDGKLMRFQRWSFGYYLAEYYDHDYNIERSVLIKEELAYFGGFYASGSHYYILTGQENWQESDDVECFRITKYDLNWNRLGSVSLSACNTRDPFKAGSARFAMCGKYLLIHTCHTMYKGSDGKNHQANVTIQVDTETMTITDSFADVFNTSNGYVSHSFNQFIHIENNRIVTVDHGDAYPRSIVLIQYPTDVSTGAFNVSYPDSCTATDLLSIPGSIGQNWTGVSVGGFEISSSSYLVAYNAVPMDDTYGEAETRNIWVAVMDKSTGAVTQKQITSYAEGEESVRTPHLVKLSDSAFMLMWTREDTLYYAKLDGDGDIVGDIYSIADADLSDCAPLVSNGKLIWYTWWDEVITFYDIDLNNPSKLGRTVITNGHPYQITSPATTPGGKCTITCERCGDTQTFTTGSKIKTYINDYDGNGYYLAPWGIASRYDVGMVMDMSTSPDTYEDFNDVIVTLTGPDGTSTVESGKLVFDKPGTYKLNVSYKYNATVSETYTINISHIDSNADGYCDECGEYDAPVLSNGAYQLETVRDLKWFAGLVNGTLEDIEQNTAANAILMADLDLSGMDWEPIGSGTAYAGTFDGSCHVIYNVSGSLFGSTSGAVIRNLGTHGLLAQELKNSAVTNCFTTGSSIADDGSGSSLTNCWTDQSTLAYNLAEAKNCYYLSDTETDTLSGTTCKSADQFASGEVCWLLNNRQIKPVFFQTAGSGLPAFSGKTVYYGYASCESTRMSYNNTSADQNPGHDYGSELKTNSTHHYYQCADCSQRNSTAHTYTNGCDPDCNGGCGYSRKVSHSYQSKWSADESRHWHECSICGTKKDDGAHSPGPAATETTAQICTTCEYVISPALGHIHSYDAAWMQDRGSHWHACTGCSERQEIGVHEYTDGCDDTCDTCGYIREDAHSFAAEYTADQNGHWYECADCGAKMGEEAHISDEETTDTAIQRCVLCGWVMGTQEGHEHSFSPDWRGDSDTHWHSCACGQRTDDDPHHWDAGVVTQDPTADAEGRRTFTCTDCGWTRTEPIEKLNQPTTSPTEPTGSTVPYDPITSTQSEKLPEIYVWIAFGVAFTALLTLLILLLALLLKKK